MRRALWVLKLLPHPSRKSKQVLLPRLLLHQQRAEEPLLGKRSAGKCVCTRDCFKTVLGIRFLFHILFSKTPIC